MGARQTNLRAHPEVKQTLVRRLCDTFNQASVESLVSNALYLVKSSHETGHATPVPVGVSPREQHLYDQARRNAAETIQMLPVIQLLCTGIGTMELADGPVGPNRGEPSASTLPPYDRARHLLAIEIAALLNNNFISHTENWCRTDEDKRYPALLPLDENLLMVAVHSEDEDSAEPNAKRRAQRNALLSVAAPSLINAWSLFIYTTDVDDTQLEGPFIREQLQRFDRMAHMQKVEMARGFIRAKLMPEHAKLRQLKVLKFEGLSVRLDLSHIHDAALCKFMNEFNDEIVRHMLDELGVYPMNLGTVVIEQKIKELFGRYLWEKHELRHLFEGMYV